MSTDEENINTASIEEMINANLSIDPAELEESSPVEPSAADELTEIEIPEEAHSKSEEVTPKEQSEIVAEDAHQETIEQAETNDNSEDQSVEEPETIALTEREENTTSDEAESSPVELDETDSIENETSELTETVTQKSTRDSEPMLALENEVSELENEIQEQLNQFVEQASHLKSNIQNELQRVSSDNEKLHDQVDSLVQQLSDAEGKIQGFTEVQDKQQATIHKLILIVKGIRTKISHLYDEE